MIGHTIEPVTHLETTVIHRIIEALRPCPKHGAPNQPGQVLGMNMIRVNVGLGQKRWQTLAHPRLGQPSPCIDTRHTQDVQPRANPDRPGTQLLLGIPTPTGARTARPYWPRLLHPVPRAVPIHPRGADINHADREGTHGQCRQQAPGAQINEGFALRWRKVQNYIGHSGQPRQAATIIQITPNGPNTPFTEHGYSRWRTIQRVELHPTMPRRCLFTLLPDQTQRDIPTPDNQYSQHPKTLMPCQITLQPSGHQFTAEPTETLLEAALKASVNLPYGCRNGACGACKGRVIQGEVDLGTFQPTTLTMTDRAEGRALLCTAHARSDLTLEIREVSKPGGITPRTLPCRVERMERLAPDVMALWLKLPANERLQFLPGQYIDFLFKDGRRRSFSLANNPEHDKLIELHIRHVPGGWFTDQVFSSMKVKDILRIHGPLGSFSLRDPEISGDKPAILLAGGTGYAPIKSILSHALHNTKDRHFILYWGARTRTDLYQAEVPQQWAQQFPRFEFIPVLSAPTATDAWPGRTGLVHEAVLADFPDLSGVEVYACGAPAMVDAARRDFTTHGLAENAFYADSFNFQG